MRIRELTLHAVRVPLRKKIRHASHSRTDTENLVARAVLDDGTTGYGEGVPREYVTGETVESGIERLRAADLPAQFERCTDITSALVLAERLSVPPAPGDARGISANAARCAVELAILDAYLRAFQAPLSKVTLRLGGDLYAPQSSVRYSGAITSTNRLKLGVAAWGMRLYGFKQVKVKVGVAGQDDVSRLRLVRNRVGTGVALRVDANEAYTLTDAAERIRALEAVGIGSVEQPLPVSEDRYLPGIRSQIQTPLMADESVCSLADAERIADGKLFDALNLRLSKCGGFIPTLRIALLARRAGLTCQLGCQVGETGVLSAAGRAFASSVGGLTAAEGSYDRHLIKRNLIVGNITFGWGGKAPQLRGAGLGVAVDPKALAALSHRTESLLG